MPEMPPAQQQDSNVAVVAKVIDVSHVVINRGTRHGIKAGQRFSLYNIGKEAIKDPVTGEELGQLETAKGTGRIIHVQEKMSILESDKAAATLPGSPVDLSRLLGLPPTVLPFNNPAVGDIAKPI